MRIYKLVVLAFFTSVSTAQAAGSYFGINAGFGLPYTSQAGINYILNDRFSFDLSSNSFAITAGSAKVGLSKIEASVKWHVFSGSFFLGLGLGQQSFLVTGTDSVTSLTAKFTVTSTAVTPSLGWLWGIGDGGMFFGMDAGFQSPSGAKTTIDTNLAVNNQAYIDALAEANRLGSTAIPVFTMLRLGYLF